MKEKIMFPYFIWQQPNEMNPLDQRKAAKLEDLFYAQYGGLSIKARFRRALEIFAKKEKSICNVKHREVTAEWSAHNFSQNL
jgi:hypothetical protein